MKSKRNVFILSIDGGGGSKAVVAATVLKRLEEVLEWEISKQIDKTAPKADIYLSSCFDIIAGSSTGALLAMGLAVPDAEFKQFPRYKADTFVELIRNRSDILFSSTDNRCNQSRSSSSYKQVKLLKPMNIFGSKSETKTVLDVMNQYFMNYALDNAVTPIVLTALDATQGKVVVIDSTISDDLNRNYRMKDLGKALISNQLICNVNSLDNDDHAFMDSRTVVNNPTVIAYLRAKELYPLDCKFTVISVGSGNTKSRTNTVGALSEYNEEIINRLAKLSGDDYYRIQLELSGEIYQEEVNDSSFITDLSIRVEQALQQDPSFREIVTVLKKRFEEHGNYIIYRELEQITDWEECVDVSGVKLKTRGIWELCYWLMEQTNLKPNCSLEKVNLRNTGIVAPDLQFLFPIADKIKMLNLSDNQMGPAVEHIFGEDTKFTSLETLYLCNAGITVPLLQTLLKSPNISTLDLRNNSGLSQVPLSNLLAALKGKSEYMKVILDIQVQNQLGHHYRNTHTFNTSLQWFLQSAEHNNQEAMYEAGVLYLDWASRLNHQSLTCDVDCSVCEFNKRSGWDLCLKSASLGFMDAEIFVGEQYESPRNELLDIISETMCEKDCSEQALFWYKRAIDKGSCHAAARAGHLCKSLSVNSYKNKKDALYYFSLAAERGSETAKRQAKRLREEIGDISYSSFRSSSS